MLFNRSVLTLLPTLLLTVLAEVSAGPALLGQVQQKTRRFEQSHAQKDFLLGTTATIFFFGQKEKRSRHRIFASKRPISLLQGDELECPQGNREVPRTAKRLNKKPVFSASALKWDTRGGDS